jgi:hypothetical protein
MQGERCTCCALTAKNDSNRLPPPQKHTTQAASASAPLPAEVPVAAPSALAAQNRGLVTAEQHSLLEECGRAALAQAPLGADAAAFAQQHVQASSAVLLWEAELAAGAIAEQEGAAAAGAMAHGGTLQPLSQLLARPLPAPPPAPALWPAPAEEVGASSDPPACCNCCLGATCWLSATLPAGCLAFIRKRDVTSRAATL